MKKQSQVQTTTMQIPSELVAKAKAGDGAAFSELYSLTSANLYRCIRAMTRDEELTWDIQQDTYLRAYRSLNTLEDNNAFFPWLRRIAANVTATQMSKRLPLSFSELGDDEENAIRELPDPCMNNQPELSLDRQETSRLVQEILASLPEEQHLILGMRYYDELSVKEIAALLSIAPGTVMAQLYHGRKKVETAVRALEKQGVKLYGLTPVAFLMALLRSMEPTNAAKQAALNAAITRATGSAVGAAVPIIQAQTVGQTLLHGFLGKALLGVLSVAVIGGAIWGGLKLLDRNSPDAPYRPTETTALYVSDPEHTTDPSAERTTEDPAALSGVCGENLTWSFEPESEESGSRGCLIIQGSGAMSDFDNGTAPWFDYRKELREVILPNGLTSIGNGAFENCEVLDVVANLPDGLTSIGNRAFSNCTALRLNLPKGLTHIGERAFNNCTALSSLTLPAATTDVVAFAFAGCTKLEQVILPETFSEFSVGLFDGCIGLTEVDVLNPDCVFYQGSLSGVPKTAVLCGFSGSTAEQYANENGFSFTSIAPEAMDTVPGTLDSVLARVAEDEKARAELKLAYPDAIIPDFFGGVTGIDSITADGSRYLVKLVHLVTVTATEEEMEQAEQTRTLVLQGKEYRLEGHVSDHNAWIEAVENDSVAYRIHHIGSQSCFSEYFYGDQWIAEITDTTWVWLDGDTPVDSVMASTLEEFAEYEDFYDRFSTRLELDADGKPVIRYTVAG